MSFRSCHLEQYVLHGRKISRCSIKYLWIRNHLFDVQTRSSSFHFSKSWREHALKTIVKLFSKSRFRCSTTRCVGGGLVFPREQLLMLLKMAIHRYYTTVTWSPVNPVLCQVFDHCGWCWVRVAHNSVFFSLTWLLPWGKQAHVSGVRGWNCVFALQHS